MERITELTDRDRDYLYNVLKTAVENGERVRIHQTEESQIKVARGGSVWTLPFGKDGKR